MRSKLSDLKSLYTTLGGESTDVLNANSEIAVLNGILALDSIGGCQFIPDAIKAIADNFALIDPSPAATLIEKTVTANGTYNATSDSANGYSSVTVNVPTGADTFAVTITAGDSITADKTYSEIMTAINANSKVVFTFVEGETSLVSSGYYVFINDLDVNEKIIMISVPGYTGYELGKMTATFMGMSSNNEFRMIKMTEDTRP